MSDDALRSVDVVAIGEPLLEFNQRDGSDSATFLQGFGGDTSNVAVAAARQGARVAYLTRVGDDAFGRRFLDLWQREGIDLRYVVSDADAPTGVYFVHHDDRGHHFTYYRAGSAASRLHRDDLPVAAIADARALHVSGISQAISGNACDAVAAAIAAARDARTLVSYDPNVRLKLWAADRARSVVLETVAQVDVVLPSLEDVTLLFGERDPEAHADRLLECGVGTVALKLGRDGVFVATADERRHVPGFVVRSVDATGAGDTFDGAFLAERLRGAALVDAARYANAAAALATRGFGAVDPMPHRSEVERFLAER